MVRVNWIAMARGPGGSLLVPILLAFVVGILLYLYWGVSSQLGDVQADSRGLKRDLAGARNERDNLQYRLNLLREDLDVALQKKDELEGRAQEEEANRQAAEDKVVSGMITAQLLSIPTLSSRLSWRRK